jgi:hypothetical protein
VLHPAGLREVLRKFLLGDVADGAGLVEQNGPRAGGTLVNGENVGHLF